MNNLSDNLLISALTNNTFLNYEIQSILENEGERIKRLKLKVIELFEGGFSFEVTNKNG